MIRLYITYGVCAALFGTTWPRFALLLLSVVNRFPIRWWTLYPFLGRTTAVLFTATLHARTPEWISWCIWLLLRFQFRLEIRESAICSIWLTWLLLSWRWLARRLSSLLKWARTLTLTGLDVWDFGLLGSVPLDSVQFFSTSKGLRALIAAAAFNWLRQTLRLLLCCCNN